MLYSNVVDCRALAVFNDMDFCLLGCFELECLGGRGVECSYDDL